MYGLNKSAMPVADFIAEKSMTRITEQGIGDSSNKLLKLLS
jgi:hypothetical protein